LADKSNPEISPSSEAGEIASEIEWHDIQGIIRRGCGRHRHSVFAILKVTNRINAGKWLAENIQYVVSSEEVISPQIAKTDCLISLAFTAPGLAAMGFEKSELQQFSQEFQSGMAPLPQIGEETTRRSGMLGDTGKNAPQYWLWGGYGLKATGKTRNANDRMISDETHLILSIYGTSKEAAEIKYKQMVNPDSGVALTCEKRRGNKSESKYYTYLRPDDCEHFGYRDGVSQPIFKGSRTESKIKSEARDLHIVAPGEFILGYPSERQQPVPVPVVNLPSASLKNKTEFLFGKNGSYLVVRQLEQDVDGFHKMLESKAANLREFDKPEVRKDWLAARIMGRHFSGEPIAKAQEDFSKPPVPDDMLEVADIPEKITDKPFPKSIGKRYDNDFRYAVGDRDGLTCPLTAHIRRAFPRDGLGPDRRVALKIANRHRILRRGRLYGTNPRNDSQKTVRQTDSKDTCGLFFLAFNADFAGQFETVQHSWMNNRHFDNQYNEIDLVAGLAKTDDRNHTIQHQPINIRLGTIGDYITVRGGGYFFMPGLQALQVLADIARNRS